MMCKCSGAEERNSSCVVRVLAVIAGVLAFAGAVALVCRLLSGRSENHGCPCKCLMTHIFHRKDANAADYAD